MKARSSLNVQTRIRNLFRFLFSALLLCAPFSSDGATATLTIVTNPPDAGTVTGAGTYVIDFNSPFTPMKVSANAGWFLKAITFNGPTSPGYNPEQHFNDVLASDFQSDPNFDATTITNFDFTLEIEGDSSAEVTFGPLAPALVAFPPNIVAVSGSPVSLTSFASGRRPLAYRWQKDGVLLPDQSGSNLVEQAATPADSGIYTLTVSNNFGTNTVDASITIRDMLLSLDGTPILGTTTNAVGPALVSLTSKNGNDLIFYTLDGSEPSLASSFYNGPFSINRSATIRAKGYSPDFSTFVSLDPISITVVPTYQISTTANGGKITLDPQLDRYSANATVTFHAVPDPGWTFMQWANDGADTHPEKTISVTNDMAIEAIFGTPFHVVSSGNGTAALNPNVPLYPYGFNVSLTAIPNVGYAFDRWIGINADSAYSWAVTETNKTALAQFSPLDPNTVELTIVYDGHGDVSSSNDLIVTTGDTISLRAMQTTYAPFLGWDGDATGTSNPITITMDRSKTVIARFARNSVLELPSNALGGPFTLFGSAGDIYEIQSSSDLSHWNVYGFVTNFFGTAPLPQVQTPNSNLFFRARNSSVP